MSRPFAANRREPSKPHQCTHWDDDGNRCRAFAMYNEFFCYRHRVFPVPPVIENEPFEITHLDSRAAIQQALADLASRLACNRMDLKRAGLLAYTLQIASANIAADTSQEPLPIPDAVLSEPAQPNTPEEGPLE